MSEQKTKSSALEVLLTVVLGIIALRMLAGLVVLAIHVTGITITWLQDGASLEWLTLRPRDFIILGIVLALHVVHHQSKRDEEKEQHRIE